MSDRIEQAARVLYEDDTGKSADDVDVCDQWELDQWRGVAAVLHKAGLLATREEWGVQITTECGSTYIAATNLPEAEARRYAALHHDAVFVKRRVTEWEASE